MARRKRTEEPQEKRAANGEGSVYQRKSDGRWVAALPVGRTPSGGVKRVIRYADPNTEKQANRELAKLIAEQGDGRLVTSGRLTVRQYLERWLRIKKANVELRTWASYESLCRLHLVPSIGHLQLSRLSTGHLKELYAQKVTEEGLSSQMALHIHRCIHAALQEAVEDRTIPFNPAAIIKAPVPHPEERRFLSIEEAQLLIQALEVEPDWGALIMLTLTTGLREGEVAGLRWNDLNLHTGQLDDLETPVGQLKVVQVVSWPGRRALGHEPHPHGAPPPTMSRRTWIFKPRTKSGKPRPVPILPSVIPLLQDHRKRQVELRMKAGPTWENNDLVFPSTSHLGRPSAARPGQPIRPEQIRYHLHRILKSARLPRITFHDLRHSAASILLALGVPPLDVAKILGHTNANLVLRLYGHLMPGAHQNAAMKLEGALFGKPEPQQKTNRPRIN